MITTRTATDLDKDFLWKLKVASMRGYVEKLYGWENGRQYDHVEKTFHPETMTIIQRTDSMNAWDLLRRAKQKRIFRWNGRIKDLTEGQSAVPGNLIEGEISRCS